MILMALDGTFHRGAVVSPGANLRFLACCRGQLGDSEASTGELAAVRAQLAARDGEIGQLSAASMRMEAALQGCMAQLQVRERCRLPRCMQASAVKKKLVPAAVRAGLLCRQASAYSTCLLLARAPSPSMHPSPGISREDQPFMVCVDMHALQAAVAEADAARSRAAELGAALACAQEAHAEGAAEASEARARLQGADARAEAAAAQAEGGTRELAGLPAGLQGRILLFVSSFYIFCYCFITLPILYHYHYLWFAPRCAC